MTNQSKIHTTTKPSKLDQFDLKYELDIPWSNARETTRRHTLAK